MTIFHRVKRLFKNRNQSVFKPIESDLLLGYTSHRKIENQKALCHAPFTNLYFGRQGNVLCCCHNRKHIVGTYPNQSISQIWEGEKLKELQEYLRNNDLSSGCHVCKWDIEQQQFENVKAIHFDTFKIDSRFPVIMEFELDNTCNLECSMCSGEFSSTIRKNRDGKPPIQSVYDASFVEQLTPFIPHLATTRFSGGEPFLIDIYFDIWTKIVALNPNCLVAVQTNGTVLNNKIKAILEKGRFEIGISLDGLTKTTFEGIRRNAIFERVLENISYFSEYCARKNTCFRISVCAMRENWKELPLYIDFCEKYNATLEIHNVWFPPSSSLWNLEKVQQKEIIDFLKIESWQKEKLKQPLNLRNYKIFIQQLQTWHDSNREIEPNIDEFSESFKLKLFQSISDHILNDKAIKAEVAQVKISTIVQKATLVFAQFNDEQKVEKASQKMLQVPVELLVSSLTFESEERIYEQAIAFLND